MPLPFLHDRLTERAFRRRGNRGITIVGVNGYDRTSQQGQRDKGDYFRWRQQRDALPGTAKKKKRKSA